MIGVYKPPHNGGQEKQKGVMLATPYKRGS